MEDASLGIVSGEPIVLIGPGSEWFWTMAQFVVVAVTLVGIYYQFRLQRAANAFQQVQDVSAAWHSERLLRARLRVARDTQAGRAPDLASVGVIGDHWESVASLIRAGHVSADVVYQDLGDPVRFWWKFLAEEIRRERQAYGLTLWRHFEWLADEFERKAKRDGSTMPELDPGMLGMLIADYEGQIRLSEESRMPPQSEAPARLPPGTEAAETSEPAGAE
jgi:hypothetical protein